MNYNLVFSHNFLTTLQTASAALVFFNFNRLEITSFINRKTGNNDKERMKS